MQKHEFLNYQNFKLKITSFQFRESETIGGNNYSGHVTSTGNVRVVPITQNLYTNFDGWKIDVENISSSLFDFNVTIKSYDEFKRILQSKNIVLCDIQPSTKQSFITYSNDILSIDSVKLLERDRNHHVTLLEDLSNINITLTSPQYSKYHLILLSGLSCLLSILSGVTAPSQLIFSTGFDNRVLVPLFIPMAIAFICSAITVAAHSRKKTSPGLMLTCAIMGLLFPNIPPLLMTIVSCFYLYFAFKMRYSFKDFISNQTPESDMQVLKF